MLRLVIEDYSQDRWNRLIGDFSGLSLLQRWEYAEAKAGAGIWTVERGVFFKGGEAGGGGEPVGAFQVLIRPLPAGFPGGLAWINRGPLYRNGEDLAAMMGLLRDRYARERGMYLRIAPAVGNFNAEGFAPAGCPGWASAVVDLTPTEDALRAALKRKWRGHLSKSERSGLELRSGCVGDVFNAFLESHEKLVTGKDFATSVTTGLLQELQDLSAPDAKMEAFLAYQDGTPVAGALMVKYGGTCEYLAGNAGPEGRRRGAGQFVLWRALLAMKAQGFTRLDLGGMDPELTPKGIYTFKEGLAGAPYRLAEEVEALGQGFLGGGLLSRLVRWRVNRARADR